MTQNENSFMAAILKRYIMTVLGVYRYGSVDTPFPQTVVKSSLGTSVSI